MIAQLYIYSETRLKANLPQWKRFLYSQIDFQAQLIGIVGARGAGKTTLALQYLVSLPPRQRLYVSCDHPLMQGISLFEFAEQAQREGIQTLVIDEIHKAKTFSQDLKNIYDFLSIQVIFTGSSALHLYQSRHDVSRRALLYTLPELSFREYLALTGQGELPAYALAELLKDHEAIAADILRHVPSPLPLFRNYLQQGAYPYIVEGETSYLQRLIEVINQTLREDIAILYEIEPDKLEAMMKLLRVLCASKPYAINYEKLSAAAEIARNTLKRYLYYLEQASLIRRIGGRIRGNSYIAKPDKLYLHNPNLFQVLCPIPNTGSIRESFFAMMLGKDHTLAHPKQGDFLIDDTWLFEIGGPNKDATQIADQPNAYLALDSVEHGFRNRIPLWLFGFLY